MFVPNKRGHAQSAMDHARVINPASERLVRAKRALVRVRLRKRRHWGLAGMILVFAASSRMHMSGPGQQRAERAENFSGQESLLRMLAYVS